MKSISSPPAYSMTTTKSYWCHLCRREFSKIYIEDSEVQCLICKSTLCEEIIEKSPSPSEFTPYNMNDSFDGEYEEPEVITIPSPNSLVSLIANLMHLEYDEEEIESIINNLMLNDPNKYGTPPASKTAIETLETYEINQENLELYGIENTCPICKEELLIKQKAINMPCKHYYHTNCIIPWLTEHNSCPICRVELPTDDIDYENWKKSLQNQP